MTDGLTDDERALAWLASWHPSFEGKAIVNPDFTFRAVNPQFCEILGVSPGEIINNSFTDITPPNIRELDMKNAALVMDGVIDSYLLPKSYEFASGRKIEVTLLVNGVYHPVSGVFMFFVSTIMARRKITSSTPLSQMPTGLMGWIDKRRVGWGVLTIIGAGIAAGAKHILELFK